MALSTRDRDRLKVLSEAKKGLITQKQAADQLQPTERHVRRLVARIRHEKLREEHRIEFSRGVALYLTGKFCYALD